MEVDFIVGTQQAFDSAITAIFNHKHLLVGKVVDTNNTKIKNESTNVNENNKEILTVKENVKADKNDKNVSDNSNNNNNNINNNNNNNNDVIRDAIDVKEKVTLNEVTDALISLLKVENINEPINENKNENKIENNEKNRNHDKNKEKNESRKNSKNDSKINDKVDVINSPELSGEKILIICLILFYYYFDVNFFDIFILID